MVNKKTSQKRKGASKGGKQPAQPRPRPKARRVRRGAGRTMPAARGGIFTNDASRKTFSCVGKGLLVNVDVPSAAPAGTVLAVLPVGPQYWPLLNMGKAAQTYQRYRMTQFAVDAVSAAPSSVTGMLGVAYINDPTVVLPSDPDAMLTMLSTVDGYKAMPAFGEWGELCNAALTKRGQQDMLFTDLSEEHDQQRLIMQGKIVIVAAAAFSTFTGSITIGLYGRWRVDFAQPRTIGAGMSTDAVLRAGSYKCSSGGVLTEGDGSALPVDFLQLLDPTIGVYYIVNPPTGLTTSVGGFAYYSSNGSVYLADTVDSASTQQGHATGSATAATLPDTLFVGRSASSTLMNAAKRNDALCLQTQYGPLWRRVQQLRLGEGEAQS